MAVVASSIGATVVRHSWCLLPKENPYHLSVLGRFNLPDFELGAQVEVLSGTRLAPDHGSTAWETYNKLQQASDEFYRENGWSIPDVAVATQFMAQSDSESDITPLTITLVDIEPRVTNFRN
jgi:hypothetical protein